MFNDYVVSSETYALIQLNKTTTRVIESNEDFIINTSLIEIMDNSCKFFGSSLSGRQDGTKYLLGFNYKLPILVDDIRNLYFFPTTSIRNNDCCWISFNNVETYLKDTNGVNVIFKNNKIINFRVSYGSFENQYYRTIKLINTINKKKITN